MNIESISRIGDDRPSTLDDEHKDELNSSFRTERFSVVGASVRGKLHIRSETHYHRDDAFAGRFDGTWLVLSVSDGAGSRELSRFGAAYSVNVFCDTIISSLGIETDLQLNGLKEIVSQGFKDTRKDLEQFCSEHGVRPEDLHCTLLSLILNTTTGEVVFGQIGDGLILGLSGNREAKPLVEPPNPGEVGVSYFLTQPNWGNYLRIESMTGEEASDIVTFYLMTDGVADDCQYGPPEDILQLWSNDIDREVRTGSMKSVEDTARNLQEYLNTYQAQGSFDDRTLVVIYKTENLAV